jgi:TetR/AcrR family transcriptional repressor of bet genes
MNRPSLAPVRRAQILDAVEACILEEGIEGVTFSRVARRAGVRTSMVPHYFGTKGSLMAAMVDRVLGRVEGLLDAAVDGATGRDRIERLLDVLFGGAFAVPSVILVLDQLRATAHVNVTTRDRMVAMFRHLEQLADGALADAYPDAPAVRRRNVAYSLLCLSDANNSFRGVGFPPDYDSRARAAAEVLLDALDDHASVAPRS